MSLGNQRIGEKVAKPNASRQHRHPAPWSVVEEMFWPPIPDDAQSRHLAEHIDRRTQEVMDSFRLPSRGRGKTLQQAAAAEAYRAAGHKVVHVGWTGQ